MTNDTQDAALSEFLLARITEDETRARRFHPQESLHVHFSGDLEPTVLYTARQVRDDLEAKRRVAEMWPLEGSHELADVWRLLALPYAAHDDYRGEWKP